MLHHEQRTILRLGLLILALIVSPSACFADFSELVGNTLVCSGNSSIGMKMTEHLYVTAQRVFRYISTNGELGTVFDFGQRRTGQANLAWYESFAGHDSWSMTLRYNTVWPNSHMVDGYTLYGQYDLRVAYSDGRWILRQQVQQSSDSPNPLFYPVWSAVMPCALMPGRFTN